MTARAPVRGATPGRSRARALALLLSLTLATFLGSTARADEYDVALLRAVAAKERALDSGHEVDWERALAEFEALAALRRTREAEYEIGFCATELGRIEVAVAAYRAALELGLGGRAAERARAYLGAHPGAAPPPAAPAPPASSAEPPGAAPAPVRSVAAPVTPARSATAPVAPPSSAATPPLTSPSVAAPPALAPEPDRQGAAAGPALMAVGAGFMLGGAVLAASASRSLEDHRDALPLYCEIRQGSDRCVNVFPGASETAQREVNAIATQKAIRAGAFAGVAIGVTTGITGIILFGRSRAGVGGPPPQARWGLEIAPDAAVATWETRF